MPARLKDSLPHQSIVANGAQRETTNTEHRTRNAERKTRNVFFALLALVCAAVQVVNTQSQEKLADYKNPGLPVERRVADLLGRMTVDEKVAQLVCLWQQKPQQKPAGDFSTDRGDFSPEKAAIVMKNGIGQISRQRERKDPRESALFANAVQKFLVEKTRLGIPAMFHDEALHGHMAQKGTSFPQPIALASSWDLELIGKVFTAAALEARARGGHQVLGPNLDLARDPRWGRTEETYGEDPYLVSRMGVACITALQGKGPGVDGEHVIATAKHYAAHGQPEGGTNIAPANYSERVIREFFLPSFHAAVTEAGIMSVMPSYNEIDGVPSHASKFLLEKVLRQEWGFTGVVASDYYGIPQLQSLHHVAADKAEAARLALEAGVDIELPDPDCYPAIPQLLKDGRVSEAALDKAVGRNLKAKFLLGLFENPYVDPERAAKITNSQPNRELAAEAARRSIVLLKNENNILPLDRSRLRSIAVIGPNADRAHLGGYSDNPGRGVSVLQGITDKVGDKIKLTFSAGCKITQEGGNWWADTSHLSDPVEDAKLIAEAVEAAKMADVAVVVVGGNEDTNKEGWADNHLGDRDSLDLIGRQNDLVKAVVDTAKPTIVMLINSGPLSLNYIAQNVPAILEGFYLGQETGVAVADVLFGDYNPAGKLPVSFPRSVGQLPIYYNHKPTARRGYLFNSKEPLFPFGYGLSYTSFEYSNLKVAPEQIGPRGRADVSVTVTNTGKRAGDEIVQLYIRDLVSSVTRPVMELKDFKRITLAPGESKTVTMVITPEKLSFLDLNMNRVVEPGWFDIMVGTSSVKYQKAKLEVVTK
ncbi:MAG TPA: glycoside hydrolase family 3 N-terminal domain-containing protein [Blastocatellia bacterium]|jgi:beta-glucosidase|nr:glycoside hydrolase family 3 N-terminal domain-containing protein [Blastocatellia bacterium]